MDYKKQYLHPEWQKKRLKILERDNFTCQCCKSKEKTLNVHHWYYIHNRNVWDYLDSAFATLCDECHKDVHDGVYLSSQGRTAHIASMALSMNDREYESECLRVLQSNGGLVGNMYFVGLASVDGYDVIESAMYLKVPYSELQTYAERCWDNKGIAQEVDR